MTNSTQDYLSEKYREIIDMKINEDTINLKDINKVLVAFCRLTQVNYFKIKELESFIMKIDTEIKRIFPIEEKKNNDNEDYTDDETKIFMKPINDEFLSLPTRVINQLLYEKILFVGELIQLTEKELLKVPNLGRKGIFDIKVALEAHNLYLKDS